MIEIVALVLAAFVVALAFTVLWLVRALAAAKADATRDVDEAKRQVRLISERAARVAEDLRATRAELDGATASRRTLERLLEVERAEARGQTREILEGVSGVITKVLGYDQPAPKGEPEPGMFEDPLDGLIPGEVDVPREWASMPGFEEPVEVDLETGEPL